MLVLTRKRGQSIVIGKDITVIVLGEDRGHVRIGVVAPPDVSVDREEIAERKAAGLPKPSHASPVAL